MADNEIIDASLVNQIALQRFIRREVREMLALFEKYDRRLARLVRKWYRQGVEVTEDVFIGLLDAIRELRAELMGEARTSIRDVLAEVGPVEYDKEWAMLAAILGLKGRAPRRPTPAQALRQPFSTGSASASTLGQWIRDLTAADFKRIRDALTQAVANEESTDQAVARVVGTKGEDFRDGVAANTRNNIRALVATSIAHVVHMFRKSLWMSTPEVVGAVWTAVLDSSTTPICRSRDNKVVMFGDNPAPEGARLLQPPGARPPAHPNCRSRMVALRRGGEMPDRTTFDQFLRAQSPRTQNQILGEAKADLYRRGELSLDDFVDDTGKELTLEQLRGS